VNANYTRRGNTLYIHQHYWPGHTPAAEWLSFYQPEAVIAIGGLKPKVLSARLLKTGQKVDFTQDEFTLRLVVCRWWRPISRPPSSRLSAMESQQSITAPCVRCGRG